LPNVWELTGQVFSSAGPASGWQLHFLPRFSKMETGELTLDMVANDHMLENSGYVKASGAWHTVNIHIFEIKSTNHLRPLSHSPLS
jgi:hypothetical protein